MIGKDILGKQGFSVSGSGKHFVNRDAVADRSKWVTGKIQVRHRIQNKRIVVVQIAQKIDTYETSILPYEDCCTIFVAKHPVTKPNINIIKRSETHLEEKIAELYKEAMESIETIYVE